MQYQSQRIKILHVIKAELINSLTTKRNNILTACKLLLLFYQFTGNVNCLIALITTEKRIELPQIIN